MKNYLLDNSNENNRLDFQNKIDIYDIDKELTFFNWDKKDLILDAGCGNGNVIKKLIERGLVNIHGIELSADRAMQASERFLDYKNVKIFNAALEETKLDSEIYDHIICRYIYEHINKPDDVINELKRILKPGGKISIINFDDIFFNFYTQNENFNNQLINLKNSITLDFQIGRKIPGLLKSNQFAHITWEAQTYFFKENRLTLERENTRMRLEQGRAHLSQYFSSANAYDKFANTYLDEMLEPCNVLSMTKFLISAQKAK